MWKVSSQKVITAYVERCKEVNPLINAIVEDRFEAAMQEAREVDNFLKSTTMDEASIASEKPLLGLPFTVKESIAVQGELFLSLITDRINMCKHVVQTISSIRMNDKHTINVTLFIYLVPFPLSYPVIKTLLYLIILFVAFICCYAIENLSRPDRSMFLDVFFDTCP